MESGASRGGAGPKLAVRGVSKIYGDAKGGRSVTALASTDLEVRENEVVSLMGPSGCGKSTLLNLVAGLIDATAGEVLVDGVPTARPGRDRAMVFQSDAVFPWMDVVANIGYASRMAGESASERRALVDRFVEMVGLKGFEHAWPKELSGGMRKRVDIARAYAARPSIVLMDEPFGALDVLTKEALQLELERLAVEEPRTILFVTHDIEEAIFVGDRIALMSPRPGRIARIIDVPFPRPRARELKTSDAFVELRREVMRYVAEFGEDAPARAAA